MDAPDLKLEFQKQLKDAETKIVEAEKNLKQLNEYKIKLLGFSHILIGYMRVSNVVDHQATDLQRDV